MMRHLVLFVLLTCWIPMAQAASISKVKGSSALIELQGQSVNVGDNYFAMEGGKKKAILKIAKVKGDKAIAKIIKGHATEGMTLEAAGKSTKSASHKNRSASGPAPDGRAYWGGMLGYAQDSMSVSINGTSVSMSGSGFSGKVLMDYNLFDQVWFRGMTGVEQFNTSGPKSCGGKACDATIMYLTLDFWGRYVFSSGEFRPWLGGGLDLLFPASKTATALESNSIGTTNAVILSGGFDWFISPTMYVPVSLEYGLMPKSDQVDAHWMALRVGIALPF